MATIQCTVQRSSWYQMYIEYTYTQNAKTNQTVITHALKLKQLTDSYDFNGNMNVTYYVAGTAYTYDGNIDIDNKGNKGYTITIKSGSKTVTHNADGTKTISFSCSGSCNSGGYGPGTISLSSTDVALARIDRTAPTVSHSTSNITANSFKINATSSVTADIWEYSKNGGTSYTQFSTTSGTTASVTLTGLSPNTIYSVIVKARKKSNEVYGYSTAANTKTLGGSVVTSATDVNIDVAEPQLLFSLTVYDSNYYHKLTVKNGNTTVFSVNLGKYTAGTSQAKTYTLTSSQRTSMLNQIPNATSFTATLEIKTYSDSAYSTQIGTESSKTAKMLTTPETSKPTFTAFTYQDTRSEVTAATEDDQVLVQGYSWLAVSATAGTAKNGASISSYSVEIGDVSKTASTTSIDVGIIDAKGAQMLKVTCIDSRGYSTSVTKTVNVLEYAKPKLSSYTLRRKDEIEDIIQLSFNGSFSPLKADGTTDTNSLKFAGYYYKRTDSNTWSSFVSIKNDVTVNSNSFSFSTNQLMIDANTALSLDTDYSWDFHLMIRDELDYYASYDLYAVIPQGTPIVAIRKRNNAYPFPRVGINNPSPSSALDVSGNIRMNGENVMGLVMDLTDQDLNTITEAGFYSQFSANNITDASSMHYPIVQAGFLEVLVGVYGGSTSGGMFLLQRYTGYECNYVFIRYRRNNTWGAWKQITTSTV